MASASGPAKLRSLTDNDRQRLEEFCGVTKLEDIDTAVQVLQSKHWNVQRAIEAFYEPGYVDQLIESEQAGADDILTEASRTPSENTEQLDTSTAISDTTSGSQLRQRQTAAVSGGETARERQISSSSSSSSRVGINGEGQKQEQEQQQPSFRWLPLLAWPFSLSWRISMYFVRMVLALLGRRHIAYSGVPRSGSVTQSSSTSLLRDSPEHNTSNAARAINDYEEMFGAENHPPFFNGTYAQALETARRELKYLIVILWSKEHDDSQMMGKVLNHELLVSYLGQPRFIVWIGDVSSSEAYHVASTLQAAAYPFFALAALKLQPISRQASGTGSRLRLNVVARIDGLPQGSPESAGSDRSNGEVGSRAHKLLQLISGPVDQHDQILQAARREQEERDSARRLREQQDEAYRTSLARDRAREREAREREEQERQEQEREQERQREEERMMNMQEQWRWAKFAELQKDEAACGSNDGKSLGKLSLRLENGQRIVKSFPGSMTVQSLFDFVETRGVADQWEKSKETPYGHDLGSIEAPKGYVHEYDFVLVSQFPRAVFADKDMELQEALSAKGMWPSAVLFVEPIFEGDEQEEGGGRH